jgi:hypothetical protein
MFPVEVNRPLTCAFPFLILTAVIRARPIYRSYGPLRSRSSGLKAELRFG